ncbi:hypothetical protein [Sphingobacterium mizutaii]|uniref:hypothetical protein n=1 Tax=Sphingobacterium mizutaii TaxID=1010 RepID=UPI0028987484|nr:hypothetical protein [Sphingobacterium mizutaii]
MEAVSEYQQQALNFLNATSTSVTIKFKTNGDHFKDGVNRDIYRVRIKNKLHSFSFDFGQSVAGTNAGEVPTEYEVLACLHKQEEGIENFEDFCDTFGYEQYNDYGRRNKVAYKTYLAVYKEWENIQKLFTDEQIELLQEIQ